MLGFLRKIWALVRPYRNRLFLGLVCGTLFALSNALLMVVVKIVPDMVFGKPDVNPIANLINKAPEAWRDFLNHHLPQLQVPHSKPGIVLAICAIPVMMFLRGLFSYLNVYLMSWAATRAVADLRFKLFNHLQNLSLDFFLTARTGNLISRLISDTATVHNTIAYSLSTMIKDPLTVIGLLVLLLTQQTKLTLLSMLVFPVCVLPVVIYGRKVRKSAKAMQGHLADLADVMHEAFTGNRIVKAYNLESAMSKRFSATLRSFVSQFMRILRATETPGPVIEVLSAIGISLVFLYVVFYADPKPTEGDMLQFVAAIFMLYQPVKAISKLQNQLEQARAASHRVFELLETRSTVLNPPSPVPLEAHNADIHFEDVDFDYGEKIVLRGINLTVKAGQLVALVGSSGAGKTTLTNLLLRFHDPKNGSVRIGPTDIRQVAVEDLRRQVALVSQETILFNDTIAGNIALGRPGASPAEVQAAARHAHAYDFIQAKPQGFEALVGEKGIALSGGERQRISIARALLRNAPILILDEATNALDAESERAVQAALEELMAGRTTICIAHRLSTIQKADLIVVMDKGRIIETGTHEQLVKARGIYYKFYDLQDSAFDRPGEPAQKLAGR